jgi:hypothetical protein
MNNIFAEATDRYRPISPPSPSLSYSKPKQHNNSHMPISANVDLSKSLPVFTPQLEMEQVADGEPMDWSPSVPQVSQHRAFLPSTRDPNSKLFGDSPVNGQNSAFWYKVPPAPTTPAQRRYNPPNKARLRVAPQETKENFFNTMNHRASDSNLATTGLSAGDSTSSYNNFEFAQPRFFPPTPPCNETDELVRLFANSWTLSEEEKKIPELVRRHDSRIRNGFHALFLLLGFVFWHYLETFPSKHSKHFMTAVMALAVYTGEEIIRDNHSLINKSKGPTKGQVVGIVIGSSAVFAAVATVAHIWYETGYGTILASHGHWVVAALCLHQFWLALFGH